MSRFYHLEFLTSFCNRFVLALLLGNAAVAVAPRHFSFYFHSFWMIVERESHRRVKKKFAWQTWLWWREVKKKKIKNATESRKKDLMKWRENRKSYRIKSFLRANQSSDDVFSSLHRCLVVDSLHLLLNFTHCFSFLCLLLSLFLFHSLAFEAFFHEWHCNRNCAWHRFNRKTYCHCDDKEIFFLCRCWFRVSLELKRNRLFLLQ